MVSQESIQLRSYLQDVISPLFASTVPLAVQRQTLEAMGAQAQPAQNLQIERILVSGMPAEWISFPGASQDQVFLYLHGGGYSMGSCNTHCDLASRLARISGARALVIEYRLAPEHPFPAALEDATVAYRWLLTLGLVPKHVALIGDSAGGGLTMTTLLALRDAGDPLPATAVLLSPWTDLAGTGASFITRAAFDPWLTPELIKWQAQHYVGKADNRHPLISPIYADLHGLPPLFIIVGSDECLLDDSVRLAHRAEAAGVPVKLEIWEGMWHVFPFFAAGLPEGQQAIDQIGAYLRQHLSSQQAREDAISDTFIY